MLALADVQAWTKPVAQEWSCRRTCYLSTGNDFARQLPSIRSKLMRVAAETDAAHWRLLTGRTVLPRCVECHRLSPGRDVLHTGHYDNGSVLTLSVQLSEPEAFAGGAFVTYTEGMPIVHSMAKGDAILFRSEKLHNVCTVTRGVRRALVVELWAATANATDRFS